MTFFFDGEVLGVVAASGMRVAAERGVVSLFDLVDGMVDGGWFSASEDWGDWDGVRSLGGGVAERGAGALPLACLDLGVAICSSGSAIDGAGATFGGRPRPLAALTLLTCGIGSST